MEINSFPHPQMTAGARDRADRKFKFSAGYQRHPYLTLESLWQLKALLPEILLGRAEGF